MPSIWEQSGIAPNESNAFLNEQERNELFGSVIKPDRIRLPTTMVNRESQQNPAWNADSNHMLNQYAYTEFNGEFTILRGFSGMEHAMQFSVTDPQKVKNGDHIVYVVRGREQSLGYFEVLRRFSDFLALRTSFVDRFPGLYIPPIPSKKSVGNTKPEFVDERCFLLNMFIRQLARCPYLVESQEFQIFVKP